MALQKQIISVPFSQGVDTKEDPKLSVKPSRVENLSFDGGGTLVKRIGTKLLSSASDTNQDTAGTLYYWPFDTARTPPSKNTSSGEAIFSHGSELVRVNGGATSAYSPGFSGGEWVTRPGGSSPFTIANTRIQRSPRTQGAYDQASVGGICVFSWMEYAGPQQGIHVAVYDENSGTFLQTGASAISGTSNYTGTRCVAVGSKVYVIWSSKGDGVNLSTMGHMVVDTLAPETQPTAIPDFVDTRQTLIDACAYSGGVAVAYITAAGTISVFYIGSTGSISLKTNITTSLPVIVALGMAADSNGALYVAFNQGSSNTPTYYAVLGALIHNAPNVTLGQTAIGGSTSSVGTSVIGLAEATSGSMVLATSGLSGGGSSGPIFTCTLSATGVTSSMAAIPYTTGCYLASIPVVVGGVPVIAVVAQARGQTPTTLQPTGHIITMTGQPVAKALPGLCDYITGAGTFSRLHQPLLVNGSWQFLLPERGRLVYTSLAGQATDVTPVGFTRVALTPVTADSLPINRLGDLDYIGGALPMVYDGQQVFEEGFPLFPENLGLNSFTSGGSLSAGQYQWKAVYSWVDARGNLHRSPPSNAVTGTATANQKAPVIVPCLPLSSKDLLPQGATAQIDIYRTAANGTVFYRASSVATITVNSATAQTVTFSDGLSDASLIVNELLYTTGGIYDWLPPPAYSAACAHKERLIIVGLEDPFEWRSSSVRTKGEAVRFNEAWGGRVPAATGNLVGCASMDGNLFLFATGGVYVVLGDGPDLLGNNPWPAPQLVTSADAGAVSATSIAPTPMGILFKSPRGWKFLGRDLSCSYVGAEVEGYNAFMPRCVTLRPETEEIWLQCDTGSDLSGGLYYWPFDTSLGGIVLTYNYRFHQWAVIPSYGGKSACYYNGIYTRVRSDGAVISEAPNTWTDSGSHYSTVLETNWIKTDGVQGFQRIKMVELLGSYFSPCTIAWDAAYDYSPTYSALDTTVSTISTQAPGTSVQIRRKPRIQKCEAVKFRFTVTTTSGTGQGIGLTDLSFEFGVKRGAYKLSASAST